MKTKIFYLFLFLLIFGCAKKGPPTSPDRTPPFLISVDVLDQSHITITFDENIDMLSAESLYNFKSDSLYILASVATGKNIFITTDDMDTIDYQIKLSNISDISGNKQDEYVIKFRGTLNRDTIPPDIVKSPSTTLTNSPADTNLVLKFSEQIDKSRIYIMPDIKFSWDWNNQKTELKISISMIDSMTVYHIYGLFWDRACNYTEGDYSLTREKNLPLIWIKGTTKDSGIILITKSRIPLQFVVSDTTGGFTFQNLYPDNYTLIGKRDNEYITSDLIKISIPKDELSLYPTVDTDIDKPVLSILNSLYEIYFREIK
ncbi:hypothetical protein KAX02_07195 [candidate division WOR-3 bacterium]|nr:hypothetical protein [candidate division WOR-3 bacterium]